MDVINDIFSYDKLSPLLFTKANFWIFFLFVLGVFAFIYDKKKIRNAFLFAVSLFFYYKTGGYFFVLLLFSIVTDYFLGLLIADSKQKWKRKLFLIISLFINLSVLSYFKYAYFFTDILNNLFGTNVEVSDWIAVFCNNVFKTHLSIKDIILPVGISFYTFQTMSYVIDLYRKDVKPIRNIIDFGFYVTFFPQLVAGPIVRASEFVPQLYRNYQLSTREFSIALFLILNGLVKKIMISDYISLNFVDRVFDNPALYTGFENLMATYGYAIQIYCDFSGYTDIAIGVAMLLGFQLPLNFLSPYKAESISDFWRRWHISLSRWLRDYLYIPLGGNKKGNVRTILNLLITMLLGGLWHGANIKFVIWGGLHGLALGVNKILKWIFPTKKKKAGIFSHFISVFITFHFVCFAWLFFRAHSMQDVYLILYQIFENFGFYSIGDIVYAYWPVFFFIVLAFIIHWLPKSVKNWYKELFYNQNIIVKLIISIIIILVIYQTISAELQPFIYFQF